MPKFRRKPEVIEAVRWTGTNYDDIFDFTRDAPGRVRTTSDFTVIISTLEGEMTASRGDWIVRGVTGEYYPVKPHIFPRIYEPVQESLNHRDASNKVQIPTTHPDDDVAAVGDLERHNPWDSSCVKLNPGEPTSSNARCYICNPLPKRERREKRVRP